MIKKLTKAEYDKVLSQTNPHSFKHNVATLCRAMGADTPTEPLVGLKLTSDQRKHLQVLMGTNNLGHLDPLTEENVVDLALLLGAQAVSLRKTAALFGLPLEEIQDAIIGDTLEGGSNLNAAVATAVFGIARPRHPYENICDE